MPKLLTANMRAGCSIATSTSVFNADQGFEGCSSRLGAYVLPRRVLQVKIVSSADNFILDSLRANPVPDNSHQYCLEHDDNPFADDSIRVYKDKIEKVNTGRGYEEQTAEEKRTPYLQLIASKAVDHTAGIIRNIIRAVFIGLSNNPDFPGRAASGRVDKKTVVVADHEVDPFDFREMAEFNRSIRRYGFCIILSGYTFDERTQTASSYCEAPQQEAERHVPPSVQAIKSMRWRVPKPASGIFYRPRAPYNVEVYTKNHPDDPGDWQLSLIKTEYMENIMPVISVGIERELFAERRTGLIFDDGELVDVCISKGNNITAVTDIALDVVYGVINLPAATIQGVVNDVNTRQQLIAKRKELFDAQENYIKFLQGENSTDEAAEESKKESVRLGLSESSRPPKTQLDQFAGSDIPASAGAIISDPVLNNICEKLNVTKAATSTGAQSAAEGF